MLFPRIKAIREYDHDITTNLLNLNKNQRRITCVCVYICIYITIKMYEYLQADILKKQSPFSSLWL